MPTANINKENSRDVSRTFIFLRKYKNVIINVETSPTILTLENILKTTKIYNQCRLEYS